MSSVEWKLHVHGRIVHVVVSENSGTLSGIPLAGQIERVLATIQTLDQPTIVVDFSDCPFFGSNMLEGLLSMKRGAEERGGSLVLCGLGPHTAEIIRLARFDQILAIYTDFDQARRHSQDDWAEDAPPT